MLGTLNISNTVARAQGGCAAAIAELYEEYAEALRRFCYVRVHDRSAAEDLVQETFVCAWKALRSFRYRNDGAFVSWLFTIAHRQLLSYLRTQRRGYEESPLDQVAEPPATPLLDIGDKLALDDALHRLTPKQRQVIILKFFVGLSNCEIAEQVQSTEGGVKLLQIRALSNLRRMLDESNAARSVPA